MNEITFQAMIEVLGKPKEHVESALKIYVEKIRQDKAYQILKLIIASPKKREKEELWSAFAEVKIKTTEISKLVHFCIDYMPSMIEVLEPIELKMQDIELSDFLSDLQAKLHGIDMVAKQVHMENDLLKRNMGALLGNYITLLLRSSNMDAKQLSDLTGLEKSKLEDFMDRLIDKGKVDLKGTIYSLKK